MTLSLTEIQSRALEAQSPSYVVVVEITRGGSTWGFVSGTAPFHRRGSADLYEYPQIVDRVSPVAVTIDPVSRRVTANRCSVRVVDEGTLREIQASTLLRNATLTIRFAPADLPDLTHAIPYWAGLVEDITAEPGFLTIRGCDPIDFADGVQWRGVEWSRHPLELAVDVLTACGVPAAKIDSGSTLAPNTNTEISHLVVSNAFAGALSIGGTGPTQLLGVAAVSDNFWAGPDLTGATDPQQSAAQSLEWAQEAFQRLRRGERPSGGAGARAILDAIALFTGGAIYADETGKIIFSRPDYTAAAAHAWGRDDIASVEQVSGWGDNVINQVAFKIGPDPWSRVLIVKDSAAQADMAPDTVGAWVREHVVDLPFSGMPLTFGTTSLGAQDVTIGATTGIIVWGYAAAGCSGVRPNSGFRGATQEPVGEINTDAQFLVDFPGGFTQPTEAKISAARPFYLMIDAEILKATTTDINAALGPYLGWQAPTLDAAGRDTGEGDWIAKWFELTGTVTRGALGTTAAAHTQAEWGSQDSGRCFDVTPHILWANRLLARCAWGLPVIRVDSSLALYAAQIGDLVTVEDDVFTFYSVERMTSDLIWEIVGKEVDLLSDTPKIRWTLALARHDDPPWTPSIEVETVPQTTIRPGGGWGRAGAWHNDSAQTLTKGTWHVITFPDSILHAQPGWDGSDEYTIQESGIYDLSASVEVGAVPAGNWAQLRFELSPAAGGGYAEAAKGPREINGTAGALDTIVACEWTGAVLTIGDKVRVAVKHNASTDLDTIAGSAHLSVRKVVV